MKQSSTDNNKPFKIEADSCFYYKGHKATNFGILHAIKYKVLDAEGQNQSIRYGITVSFADLCSKKCYVVRLGEIQSGSFFKNHKELCIFYEKSSTIYKLIAEYILGMAVLPEADTTYFTEMGWIHYDDRYWYVGKDGAIGRNGLIKTKLSESLEALPLQEFYEAYVCGQIGTVNQLMGFSWEDRVMFLSVLSSVLDRILEKRTDYKRTALMIVGEKGSGKTSLAKGWFGVPGKVSVVTSGTNLNHLLEGISIYNDWHFVVDDVALERLTKDKAIRNLTEIVQSYYDGKPIGIKNQIINAKPVFTGEKLIGRESVIERCMVLWLDDYVKRNRARFHLDLLDKSKTQIYSVVLSMIQWIACKLDEGRLEAEFEQCMEEARESLNIFNGHINVRIQNMIVNLYAIHLLWFKYCRAKAVDTGFTYEAAQSWKCFMEAQYSAMVLTVSSRQEVLQTLFIKFLQARQHEIWVASEEASLRELQTIAFDEERRQIGVYIKDVEGLLKGGTRKRCRSVLLLDCDVLEMGINKIYIKELPYVKQPFTQMEIKKCLCQSGWILTRPRSGKDGTNYTFSWIARNERGSEDAYITSCDFKIEEIIQMANDGVRMDETSCYLNQRSCIAVSLNSEVGNVLNWAALQNEDNKKISWRSFCYRKESWSEKLHNTLGDICAAASKIIDRDN